MSTLVIDEFLNEIPGDNVAGEELPYHIRAELEEARREVDPNDYDARDPTRPTEPKQADWPRIVALATQTLKETTKDLLVAARLTEGLTKTRGFDGLSDGLAVMRGLLERCWERLHPDVTDGDYEVRAGPFNWLADDDRGARFPHAVRNAPLLAVNGRPVSWRQWKELQDGKGEFTREDFDKAIAAAPRAGCQAVVDAVARAAAELNALAPVLAARFGRDGPGLSDLRAAVGDCHTLARQILDRKGKNPDAEPAPADAVEADAPAADGGEGRSSGRALTTRADVYARLTEAADALEQIEPHSPVPFLIRKAVEFGTMSFPDLMKTLIRDDGVLSDMHRELGIKPPPE